MNQTICPKCGQENTQHVSCTHCGIFFEKFLQNQLRQRELEQAQWEREDRRKKQWLMLGGGTLAGALVLGLSLLSSDPETDPPSQVATAQARIVATGEL